MLVCLCTTLVLTRIFIKNSTPKQSKDNLSVQVISDSSTSMILEKSVNTTIDLDLHFQLEALTQRYRYRFRENKLESKDVYKSFTVTEMHLRAENESLKETNYELERKNENLDKQVKTSRLLKMLSSNVPSIEVKSVPSQSSGTQNSKPIKRALKKTELSLKLTNRYASLAEIDEEEGSEGEGSSNQETLVKIDEYSKILICGDIHTRDLEWHLNMTRK